MIEEDTQTHRHQYDLISLLLFSFNKESMLKMDDSTDQSYQYGYTFV